MNQIEKARAFAALHVPGQPLVLYNIWDAGSAKAVADGGARAIATGSVSVAAAQGYPDGEKLPLELLLSIAGHIVAATDLPVSIDFEGGYASEPGRLKDNVQSLLKTGAIGLNFEDQIVGGDGLYSIDVQTSRITAIRHAAEQAGIPLFINARTDLFLKQKDVTRHTGLTDEAIDRAISYAQAGANGFFVPGLTDPDLIATVCKRSPLPINTLRMGSSPTVLELAGLGVARISAGPAPYRDMIKTLTARSTDLA